jgi:hypothetical protein
MMVMIKTGTAARAAARQAIRYWVSPKERTNRERIIPPAIGERDLPMRVDDEYCPSISPLFSGTVLL